MKSITSIKKINKNKVGSDVNKKQCSRSPFGSEIQRIATSFGKSRIRGVKMYKTYRSKLSKKDQAKFARDLKRSYSLFRSACQQNEQKRKNKFGGPMMIPSLLGSIVVGVLAANISTQEGRKNFKNNLSDIRGRVYSDVQAKARFARENLGKRLANLETDQAKKNIEVVPKKKEMTAGVKQLDNTSSTPRVMGVKKPTYLKNCNPDEDDIYDRLGATHLDTLSEIERKYRKCALECHPDRNKGKNATASFQRLNEAWTDIRSKTEDVPTTYKASNSKASNSEAVKSQWEKIQAKTEAAKANTLTIQAAEIKPLTTQPTEAVAKAWRQRAARANTEGQKYQTKISTGDIGAVKDKKRLGNEEKHKRLARLAARAGMHRQERVNPQHAKEIRSADYRKQTRRRRR